MSLDCLVFDVETIPDVDLGRRLLCLENADDPAVSGAKFALHPQATCADLLPLGQHQICATSEAEIVCVREWLAECTAQRWQPLSAAWDIT